MLFGSFHRNILIISIVIYAVTAFNSHGYYHPDEHFQIIEFAQYKLNAANPDMMPWEFQAKIRSAAQPALCYVIFRFLSNVGVANPYYLAVCLRLLTGFLALVSITIFIRSSLPFIWDRYRYLFILMSYLLWFLPFLNVRYSSETWSGLFFLLAIAMLQLKSIKPNLRFPLIGLLLGFSFLFRFQSAILALGLISWLIFKEKEKRSHILLMLSSFAVVLQLGILIDAWFYGTYVFTCWRYFYVNIASDIASRFGTSPWYYFMLSLLKGPSYPIGILIILSLILILIKKPNHVLVWTIVPFIVIQSFIPHKESRFLFPIANLAPICLILSLQEIKVDRFGRRAYLYLTSLALLFIGAVNLMGLVTMAFQAAGNGRIKITKYIHDRYYDQPVTLLFTPFANPYTPWEGMENSFYMEKNIREEKFDAFTGSRREDTVHLLVIRKKDLHALESSQGPGHSRFVRKMQSIPHWEEQITRCYDNSFNDDILILYEVISI